MPLTPNHDLPYPQASDPPDGPSQLQALAEATDTAIGVRETTTTGATSESGWNVTSFEAIKFGPLVTMRFAVERTGSDITAQGEGGSFPGNIGDADVGSIPEGWRPPFTIDMVISDGRGHGEAQVLADGRVKFRSWTVGGTISADGARYRCSATYVTP